MLSQKYSLIFITFAYYSQILTVILGMDIYLTAMRDVKNIQVGLAHIRRDTDSSQEYVRRAGSSFPSISGTLTHT